MQNFNNKHLIDSFFTKKYEIRGNTLLIEDSLGGFDKNLESYVLTHAVQFAKKNNISTILLGYVLSNYFSKRYSINFSYKQELIVGFGWENLRTYKAPLTQDYKNFVCSFNGTGYVGKQLLTAILEKQGYFNPEYSSKHFTSSNDEIQGHLNISDLNEDEIELYYKFFKNTDKFNNTVYNQGHTELPVNSSYNNHINNVYSLQNKLTQSFVNLVSETISTSYYPFVSEKFLYSIVTKGLFIAYAQPGWHTHLQKYYGFKLYDNIFDYSFDSVQNPVKRLVKLIEMLSKFSTLSPVDWRDLYFVLAKETVEYNYYHYVSGDYLKHMKQLGIIHCS